MYDSLNGLIIGKFEEIGYALGALLLSYLFWFKSDAVGSFTGYYVRFHKVDKPTPGCLLKPFAVIFFLAFCVLAWDIISAIMDTLTDG